MLVLLVNSATVESPEDTTPKREDTPAAPNANVRPVVVDVKYARICEAEMYPAVPRPSTVDVSKSAGISAPNVVCM